MRNKGSGKRLEALIDDVMPEISARLAHCWECPAGANTEQGMNLAGQLAVQHVLDQLISVLFPGCHALRPVPDGRLRSFVHDGLKTATVALREHVKRAFQYQCSVDRKTKCTECGACGEKADGAVSHLIRSLPDIQATLQQDIVAAYEGDPAAKSTMEVVMSYPGMYAIMVHRIAHVLYHSNVPLIPRIMSEFAHSRTGIDIHPGARIGPGFFIDHGTGVVVGETCVIGRNVKLYQGVTLGALSFEKDQYGRLVKGIKRHPDVGDNVVIYAGATILGGNTCIGSNSEIGGNVWLIHSIPPHSKVYNQQPKPLIRQQTAQKKTRGKKAPSGMKLRGHGSHQA
ncbi:MAG: serine O-acetyltransferase EpsC [bacterium]